MRRPAVRFAYALVLLALYYQTLLGSARPAAEPPVTVDDSTLRDIEASQLAFSAGRYAEALAPTERLTQKLPGQTMYFDRLARILGGLGRPRDEVRAWEEVFRTSPTPVDACPMLAVAYDRIPDPAGALGADAGAHRVRASSARRWPGACAAAGTTRRRATRRRSLLHLGPTWTARRARHTTCRDTTRLPLSSSPDEVTSTMKSVPPASSCVSGDSASVSRSSASSRGAVAVIDRQETVQFPACQTLA